MNDLARAYAITWSWSADSQNMPSRVDDRQVEQVLKQIGKKASRFDKSLDQPSIAAGSTTRGGKDEIHQSVDGLQAGDRSAARARQWPPVQYARCRRRAPTRCEHRRLHAALSVECPGGRELALATRRSGSARPRVQRRVELERSGYTSAAARAANFHHQLTGTYQLETNRSDDPRRVAEKAARAAPSDQRQRTYQSLLSRLEAPELIAIERSENSVTMASTRGRRVTVEADGRDHVERWSAERTMHTRATLEGERLVVATTGNRSSDFTVSFEPMENGRSLQMTRTIADEGLRQPVTVRSSYRRLSEEAQWDIEASGRRNPLNTTSPTAGDFVVPDGIRLVALLDNAMSTSAREGDPYTMTIRSPSRYEGAVIDGFVSSRERVGTHRPGGMTLNVRSIRLRDGRSSRFDGVIEGIRTPDGETVRVDREGAIDNHGSQTRKTVERSAIGAALGVVIGAIAGGGKGAAIGAVIGAGGGAGSVIVEGRDRLELERGTELTIISGDPGNQRTISGVQR